MAKKRRANPFSLSFLDIMACGFGAVTLLFLIIRHNAAEIETVEPRNAAEVNLMQEDIRQAEEERVKLRNAISKLQEELQTAQGLSAQVTTRLQEEEKSIQSDPEQQLALLRKQVEELERQTTDMEEAEFGDKVRQFLGTGNRQYLTGLKLGGERVLILVDGSASMLADTVVNAVRRRNMSDTDIKASPKWIWTLRTIDWLLAQLPPESRFQVYFFNTDVSPAIEGSQGEWLDAADSLALEDSVAGARNFVPGGGTSLENALRSLRDFKDKPDNLILLTDGLPTQGAQPPKKYMVSGEDRRKHFFSALRQLPSGIPVNTILFPMEGDPEAAALFWQLAMNSNGSFLTPSRDWP